MKSLVVFDRRVYRYRYRGKFISKTKAKSIIKQTKKLVIMDRKGRIKIKTFRKSRKKQYAKKQFKDSFILKSRRFFKTPYKIMENKNTNMRELKRYERHLKRNLSDLWNRLEGKRFYSTAVMLRTNVGSFYLSSNAYESILGKKDVILNIVDDILTKIESILLKSSIKRVWIVEASSSGIKRREEVIEIKM